MPGTFDPDRHTIEGGSYSPPPAVAFCFNFLGRDWFGAGLKGTEALTFTQLMLAVYNSQQHGLLMSKKDAMRAIGAEHVLTIKRYADLAVELGMLKLARSEIDKRVELLVPTDKGIKLVEQELAAVTNSIHWAEESIAAEAARNKEPYDDEEWTKRNERATELKASITVEAPRLEQLTLVADPMGRNVGGAPHGRPRTFRRWIEAYGETLRLLPDHTQALDARSTYNEQVGEYEEALKDCNRLIELHPDQYIGRRVKLHLELGNYDAAIADINRWLDLHPQFAFHMLRYRASAYAGKKEWELALKDLDAVIAADQTTRVNNSYDLRGRVHLALGQPVEALADLEKAYDQALNDLDLYKGAQDKIVDGAKAVEAQQAYVTELKELIDAIKGVIRADGTKPRGRKRK